MSFLKSKFAGWIKQFFLIDDTPHKIAGGAALGVFMGITPGEGVLITIFFSYILRLNRLAALAGVLAVNMWTTLIALPFAAAIGGFIFRVNPEKLSSDFKRTFSLGFRYFFNWNILRETAIPLIIGYVIVAAVVAAAVYFSLLFFLIKKKRVKKGENILTKNKLEI
ncbi:MAG: DUF2062 domain-containing protein [Parcubacteria group bacterium]|jgi:uncharacterized protein (DUF2062 family)